MATRANIVDPAQLKEELAKLGSTDDATNWVLLGYGEGKNDIVLTGSGNGGLEELRGLLDDSKIQFAVIEVVVKGDEYNPIKRVFISWIGKDVPPGLSKARAAGHKREVMDSINDTVSISTVFETGNISDINFETIAQSLTRIRPVYATSGEVPDEKKTMSKSYGSHGTQSRMRVINDDEAMTGLRAVFDGSADWAILAYVEGQKDEVEFLESGTGGIDALKAHFPTNRIYFTMLSLKVPTMGRETITKYILVTLVGSEVKPLQKARSGGQRAEIMDYVKKVLPVNAHYQPGNASELTRDAILAKFA